jgi:hypothetical protein
MQQDRLQTNPDTLPATEKSGFDDDHVHVPWWKKLFCCR